MARHRALTPGRATGRFVADFAIRDVHTGQLHGLADHRGRVLVIVFTGTVCPIGELYLPRLNTMSKRYESRGADFLAINSNASESTEEVAAHARQNGLLFPVLKDPENRVADLLLAERTCEALVIDGSGRLRYRGAIDDQYAQGSRRDRPASSYLEQAIEAVLAKAPVRPEMTQVVGCPIERTRPAKPGRTTSGGLRSQQTGPTHLNRRPATRRPAAPSVIRATSPQSSTPAVQRATAPVKSRRFLSSRSTRQGAGHPRSPKPSTTAACLPGMLTRTMAISPTIEA